MPTAAKIASSSVGGSRRTRRVPYFVFQSSLIGASHLIAEIPRCPYVALQYEFRMAIQPCIYNFSSLVASYSSIVVAPSASACSDRTKSREAGTAKCASRAVRSAHCSKNTSRSGFSQSTWTACEMQPGSVRERWTCSRLNLRTSSKLSARVVTLPVTTIMLSSRFSQLLWRGIAGGAQVQRLLRPAFQRGMSGIGQHINAALGAIEPTIDIMQQDFSGIGNFSPQILHTSRPA